MDLSGKRVVITGGTRGIGKAFAEAFDAAGAVVTVCGSSPEALEPLSRQHPRWQLLAADLAQSEERERLLTRILEGEPVDVLVNNAAVQVLADFQHDVDWTELQREIEINLVALVHLTASLLPVLLSRPAALVLNVSSGLALVPKRSAPVYCATKAAVRSFTRALRYQLAETSVRVVELLPPLVDTDMTRGRGRSKASPAAIVDETMRGVARGASEVRAGKTKLLFAIHRVSPGLAARLLRDS